MPVASVSPARTRRISGSPGTHGAAGAGSCSGSFQTAAVLADSGNGNSLLSMRGAAYKPKQSSTGPYNINERRSASLSNSSRQNGGTSVPGDASRSLGRSRSVKAERMAAADDPKDEAFLSEYGDPTAIARLGRARAKASNLKDKLRSSEARRDKLAAMISEKEAAVREARGERIASSSPVRPEEHRSTLPHAGQIAPRNGLDYRPKAAALIAELRISRKAHHTSICAASAAVTEALNALAQAQAGLVAISAELAPDT